MMVVLEDTGRASLRPPQRQPLSDAVAEAIADGIARGRLAPGDRVVEATIAAELKVSRIPVREALKVLAAQGILDGGAHKGYRVVSFASDRVSHLLEVRVELETILLRDAIGAWRKGTASVRDLEGPLSAMRHAAAEQDMAALLRADRDFHRAISNAADNHIARTLWETIARHVLIIFSLERRRTEDLPRIVRQHEELLRFIRREIDRPSGRDALRAKIEDHVMAVARRRSAD